MRPRRALPTLAALAALAACLLSHAPRCGAGAVADARR
jgi:hypothetical protein